MTFIVNDFNEKRKLQAFRESTANSIFPLLDELYGNETGEGKTGALLTKGSNPYAFTVSSENLLRLLDEASKKDSYQEVRYRAFSRKELLEISFSKCLSLNSPLWRREEGLSMKGLEPAGDRSLDFFQLERIYRDLVNTLETVEKKGSPNLLEKILVRKVTSIFEEIEETYSRKADKDPEPDAFVPHFGLVLMFLSESLESLSPNLEDLPQWARNRESLLFSRGTLTELSLIEPSELSAFQGALEKLAKDSGLLDLDEKMKNSSKDRQPLIDEAVKESLDLFRTYLNLEDGAEGSSLKDFLRILLTEVHEVNSFYLAPYRSHRSYDFLPNRADKEKYSILSKHNIEKKLLQEDSEIKADNEGALDTETGTYYPPKSNRFNSPAPTGNKWSQGASSKYLIPAGSPLAEPEPRRGQLLGIYVYSHVYTGLMITLCELYENLVALSEMKVSKQSADSYMITLSGMRSIYRTLRMVVRTLDPVIAGKVL